MIARAQERLAVLQVVAILGHFSSPVSAQQWKASFGDSVLGLAGGDTAVAAEALAAPMRTGSLSRGGALWLATMAVLQRNRAWVTPSVWTETRPVLDRWVREEPSNARALLVMGLRLYSEGARVDAARLLRRALGQASRAVPPLTPRELAILHYHLGRVHQNAWRDWRSFGQIDPVSEGQWSCSRIDSVVTIPQVNFICPELFDTMMADYFRSFADLKESDRDALEREFRSSLQADPSFRPAARQLLAELYYEARFDEALSLIRRYRPRWRDDTWTYLWLGAGLQGVGRHADAAGAFDSAIALADSDVGRALGSIARLITPGERERLAAADSGTATSATAAFWTSLDPVLLTEENDRKLEHLARLATADLLFGDPDVRRFGWETDAGDIWVRYGRPRAIRELYEESARVSFWNYGPGPDFVFYRYLTFRRNRHFEDSERFANDLSRSRPQAYRPTFLDSVLPIQAQVVRALDLSGRPALLVHAQPPEFDVAPGSVAGLTLLDSLYRVVGRWRAPRVTPGGTSYIVTGLVPGAYGVAIEIWDQSRGRLARLRDTVTTLSPGDDLLISDLLLARPLDHPETEARWLGEVAVQPHRSWLLPAGEPVTLAWETYNLAVDTVGVARIRFRLRVERAGGAGLPVRVLRGAARLFRRQAPQGSDVIEWEREAVATNRRLTDWIELSLDRAGSFVFVLEVTDLLTGAAASTRRSVELR